MFAVFEIKPRRGSIDRTLQSIRNIRFSLLALGGLFGGRALTKSLIGFNSRVEDAKLNIASMLALAKDTSVAEQLNVAKSLYDDIRKSASELPGTTEEYVNAMSRLTLPLTRAGMSLQELKDLTVNTVVAAKGINITSVAASVRDVQQFLEGRFASTDLFLSAIFDPLGFRGEEGRSKLKAMSKAQRAEKLKEALTQRQILESAKLQAQTLTGTIDKAKEEVAQFLGRVGLPLFEALRNSLRGANKWLQANKQAVERFADSVGGALLTAFTAIGNAVKFVVEFILKHGEGVKDVLTAIGIVILAFSARMIAMWAFSKRGIAAVIFMLTALIRIFRFLRDKIGDVGAVLTMVFGALGLAMLSRYIKMLLTGIKHARTLAGFVAGTGPAVGGAAGALAAGAGPAGVKKASKMSGVKRAAMGAAGLASKILIIPTIVDVATGGGVSSAMFDDTTKEGALGMLQDFGMGDFAGKLAGQSGTNVNVTKGDTTIHINGVDMTKEQLAEIVRGAIGEEGLKERRHAQAAFAGGQR